MSQAAASIGPSLDSLTGPGVVVESNVERFVASPGKMGEVNISPAPKPAAEQLIAGKFKTQDDLVKAYKELEAKLGAPKEPEKKPEPSAKPDDKSPASLKMDDPPKPNEGDPAKAEGDGKEPEQPTPADFEKYSNEFFEKGELSEESYKALQTEYRLPKEVVDTFIAGQQAIAQLRGATLHEAAGGKDAYNQLVQWGAANLPDAEKAAFNNAVDTAIRTGDASAATLLITAVKARMGGGEPNLVNTQNRQAGPSVQPFATRSEMTAAMRDPRYRSDPAYVAEVAARLNISTF